MAGRMSVGLDVLKSFRERNRQPTEDCDSNEVLARRAQDGDEQALARLLVRTRGYLVDLAPSFTDGEDPEDLAQEALQKVWQHLDSYDPERPFTAWARTILQRTAFSAGRNGNSRSEAHDAAADDPTTGWVGPGDWQRRTPEKDLERTLCRERLEAWMDRLNLSELNRRLLWARAEGANYQELAEELDMTRKALRARVHRARKRLRKAFESDTSDTTS